MDGSPVRVTRLALHEGLCKIRPGFIKRIPGVGPLLGYYIGCPACGFKNIITEGIQEQEAGITLQRAVRCGSPLCRQQFEVREDFMFTKGIQQ